ncbi:MAG: efflux RND transporter permease subunit [Gracilibacteraceae bacterium]|jgi:HAE1 family hydrophobic/amphiphilic exporter-1|nr:efflux RND transporter permease subunit [Gracilibacteraceae bacterium]
MIGRIARFSVNHPATIVVLIAALSIIGVMSVGQMSTDLMPEMDLPYVIVITSYVGAGPEEVEEQVTKPIENMIATVSGIDILMSQSGANSSLVMIGFNYGSGMDAAMADVRDRIALAESYLPTDAGKPTVMQLNPNMLPAVTLAIDSEQLSLAQLQSIAENDIEPRLSRIAGVASVSVSGGLEREVKLAVDPVKALHYGLSLTQIGSFLAADNYNMPNGDITYGNREYSVRNLQEFESVEDIGEVALTTAGGRIQLKEIAEISEAYKDAAQYTRINGRTAVSVQVQQATDGNTVEVCAKVQEEMAQIQREIGGKISVETVMDQSDYINQSIGSTVSTLLEGAGLAILVIFLFMRNLRSTAIVAIAIPLSLLATFIMLFYTGSTLNVITLGGLALGVGRMIDDSIVVFENIYRHRSLGLSARDAAMRGTAEVGGAVLASTLTLVAVFLPIGLTGGITGVMFKPLALTICVAIACSLLISLAVVPFMASRLLTDAAMAKRGGGKFFLLKAFYRLGAWLDDLGEKYKIWLRWALSHRRAVILGVVALIAVALGTIPLIGAEFMPSSDSGEISVTLEADRGSKLEEVDRLAGIVEARLAENPAVEIVYASVGSSGASIMSSGAANQASFTVRLIPKNERAGVAQVADEIEQSLRGIAGTKSTVSVSDSGFASVSSAAVAVNIRGDDLDTLRALTKEIKDIVENVPGTRNVTSSLGDGSPEVQMRISRQRAMEFGLMPAQVSGEVRAAVTGSVVSQYRFEGDEIDITVTSADRQNSDMDTLQNLPIVIGPGSSIPLAEIASFELSTGPVQISRENQTRLGTVSCDLLNRDLNSVTKDIQTEVSKIKLPAGYIVDYGGENEQMMEAFSSLVLALLMAIMLVYVVMVLQYESFRDPFVILFSLPGAVIGVAAALLVTGTSFSVTAFLGIIMLVGIAVANAIVYIDYLKQMIAAGMERTAALLETGRVRLRPILMTALATILAMTPMTLGLGEGSETNAPMAIVVIGGLMAATLVTLFLVPVVYSILDDWTARYTKPGRE